jgi:hypothetical protein
MDELLSKLGRQVIKLIALFLGSLLGRGKCTSTNITIKNVFSGKYISTQTSAFCVGNFKRDVNSINIHTERLCFKCGQC